VRADHPDLEVTGEAVEGRAGQTLAAASADAGVVVVGSRGHGGFTGMLLGSVSHAVLHAARGPVAVVQPKP
jgi:nucleotide-binding universal stress UspA family protein